MYRDVDGDVASIEIENDVTANKKEKIKVRKDKKNEISKLCKQGYEIALIGDVPSSIESPGAAKRWGSSDAVDDAVNLEKIGFAGPIRRKTAWGLNVIPSNFSIVRINGTFYGNIVGVGTYYYMSGFYATGVRPAWASTQWLSFYMTPSGGFASSLDHIAITLFFTSSAANSLIIGNGFIIGNNSGYTKILPQFSVGGCVTPPVNTQIEAYWFDGNDTYTDTCAPFSVADNVTSSYVLHANKYQDVMYQRQTLGQLYTGTKNTSGRQPAVTSGGFNPDEGGVLIAGAGFGSGNYTATFSSVSTGWF